MSSTPSPVKRVRTARSQYIAQEQQLNNAVDQWADARAEFEAAEAAAIKAGHQPTTELSLTSHGADVEAQARKIQAILNPEEDEPSKPASQKGETIRENATISQERRAELGKLLEEDAPMTPEALLSLAFNPKQAPMNKARDQALENAVKGIELATENQWASLLIPHSSNFSLTSAQRLLLLNYQSHLASTRNLITQADANSREHSSRPSPDGEHKVSQASLAKDFLLLDSLDEANTVHMWIQSIFVKLAGAILAARHHLLSTRDKTFTQRLPLLMWQHTTEGLDQDIDNPDVLRAFASSHTKLRLKVTAEMVARTRLLQHYARYGSIVFLDPCWQMRSFTNKDFAPTAQLQAVELFKILQAKCASIQDNDDQLGDLLNLRAFNADWTIIYIIASMYENGVKAAGTRLVQNYLAELRPFQLF
ncbi:hypothetical protein R3P38DRAFT_3168847 [Favolaschia claudopus]|uniref:Uncharacterized protein n=1 Tax=Favolaschia claudopus TaxID=2862362 RepID=A0AAW0E1F3_9AGAR